MSETHSSGWSQFLAEASAEGYEHHSPTAMLSKALAHSAIITDLQMENASWLDTDPEGPGMLRAMAVHVGISLWNALRTPEARTTMAGIEPKRVDDSPMGYYRGSVLVVYGLAEMAASYVATQVPADLANGAITAWASALSLFVALAPRDPESLWVAMLSSSDGSEAPGSIPEDGKRHRRSQEGM